MREVETGFGVFMRGTFLMVAPLLRAGMGKGTAKAVRAAGGLPWIVGRDEEKLKQVSVGCKTHCAQRGAQREVAPPQPLPSHSDDPLPFH